MGATEALSACSPMVGSTFDAGIIYFAAVREGCCESHIDAFAAAFRLGMEQFWKER